MQSHTNSNYLKGKIQTLFCFLFDCFLFNYLFVFSLCFPPFFQNVAYICQTWMIFCLFYKRYMYSQHTNSSIADILRLYIMIIRSRLFTCQINFFYQLIAETWSGKNKNFTGLVSRLLQVQLTKVLNILNRLMSSLQPLQSKWPTQCVSIFFFENMIAVLKTTSAVNIWTFFFFKYTFPVPNISEKL